MRLPEQGSPAIKIAIAGSRDIRPWPRRAAPPSCEPAAELEHRRDIALARGGVQQWSAVGMAGGVRVIAPS